MKKKIIIGCMVAFVVFILGIIIIIRFVPGKLLEKIVGTDSELSEITCIYPVKIQGKSMGTVFNEGEVINFDKCISDKENIAIGTIIVFKDEQAMRIVRIRKKLDGSSGIFYKASPDGRIEDYSEVFPDDIIAIYQD